MLASTLCMKRPLTPSCSKRGSRAARSPAAYAAETARAFVYDRIATSPQHRRRGLGRSLMVALHGSRRDAALPERLTATEDSRALYESLGWEVLSPYLTAYIPGV